MSCSCLIVIVFCRNVDADVAIGTTLPVWDIRRSALGMEREIYIYPTRKSG